MGVTRLKFSEPRLSPDDADAASSRPSPSKWSKLLWIPILILVMSASILTLSGQSQDQGDKEDEILVVVGGCDGCQTEVLSLTDDSYACDPIQAPFMNEFHTPIAPIYFMQNGDPVYCHDKVDCNCVKYSPEEQRWKDFATMSWMGSQMGVGLQLKDYFAITGGLAGYHRVLNTTRVWDPDQLQFVSGPTLPYGSYLHCFARINDTHAMLTGGQGTSQPFSLTHAYIFNKNTLQWTKLEPMTLPRSGHACGLVDQSRVVVASNIDSPDNTKHTMQSFDLNSLTWSPIEEIPDMKGVWGAASVQLKDTFLIIPTDDSSPFTPSPNPPKDIYIYSKEKKKVIKWSKQLEFGRVWSPAVFKLHPAYLNCVKN